MQTYKNKSNYHTNTGVSSYNPTNAPIVRKTITSDSTQNLWCRDTYWQHIVNTLGYNPFKETNGCHLRSCNHTSKECRGSHSEDSIKVLPHVIKYNQINKATFDWVKLYNCVIQTLYKDLAKVHCEEHKKLLTNIPSLNFIELIQIWRNMACYYNKLAKELPEKKYTHEYVNVKQHSSGFTFNEDVPKFKIGNNLEDTAWSFERLTRRCPIQQKFDTDIQANKQITIWDLCLATGLNCKEGVHKKTEIICSKNFITGVCSCKTTEELETQETVLQQKIIELSTQLIKIIEEETKLKSSEDNWSKPKGKNAKACIDPKKQISQTISTIEKEINQLQNSRAIHYTELGMIPFEQQLKAYQLVQEAEKLELDKKLELEKKLEKKKSTKESWEHDLVENVKIVKPIVKLGKLGAIKK